MDQFSKIGLTFAAKAGTTGTMPGEKAGALRGRLCQKSLPFVHIVLFAFLYGFITLYIAVSFRFFDF
jgi:hypothetical protein